MVRVGFWAISGSGSGGRAACRERAGRHAASSLFLRPQLPIERGERAIDVEEHDGLLPGIVRLGVEAVVAVTLRMDERLVRRPQSQHSQQAVLLGDLDHDERRRLALAVTRLQDRVDQPARGLALAAHRYLAAEYAMTKAGYEMRVHIHEVGGHNALGLG